MQVMKLVASCIAASGTLLAASAAGQRASETLDAPPVEIPLVPKKTYDNGKLMAEAWKGLKCGDRSILSDKRDIARLANDCSAKDDSVIEANARFVRQLDGRKEAAKAAARGDWRLGVIWPNFPPPPGKAPWNTPGVACQNIGLSDLAVFAGSSDTASPVWSRYVWAVIQFLATYNRELISHSSFPAARECKPGTDVGAPE